MWLLDASLAGRRRRGDTSRPSVVPLLDASQVAALAGAYSGVAARASALSAAPLHLQVSSLHRDHAPLPRGRIPHPHGEGPQHSAESLAALPLVNGPFAWLLVGLAGVTLAVAGQTWAAALMTMRPARQRLRRRVLNASSLPEHHMG